MEGNNTVTPMAASVPDVLNPVTDGRNNDTLSQLGKRDEALRGNNNKGHEEEEEVGLEEQNIGNLPSATISEADRMMDKVYGDHVHQNDGTHLDSGIADYLIWQDYHKCLVVYPQKQYDAPKGAVGCHFISMLMELLRGIKERKWNSERVVVFQMVILQCTSNVKKAKDIKNCLTWRMDAWKEGKFAMLVQTAERDMQQGLTKNQGGLSASSGPRFSMQKCCEVIF